MVELLPELLLLEELVPLLRVLLLELLTRPLLELLVPEERLLLLESFTLPRLELLLVRPLELVVPLGRSLLLLRFTLLLELPLLAERVVPLLLLLRFTLPLPLELPLLDEVEPFVSLLWLPELMLPALESGLTVALGAGSLPLGMSFHSLCVAG